MPAYTLPTALLVALAWTMNYIIIARRERFGNERFGNYVQGLWYTLLVLQTIELYHRLRYFHNWAGDNIPNDWDQNSTLMAIFLLEYVFNVVLIICAASLSIAWRRSVEHIGYNPIDDENIEERIDRIRIGLDDESAFSEDTTRTADGMTDNMNHKRYDSKKVSMADEPKFSLPATVADYVNSKEIASVPMDWKL